MINRFILKMLQDEISQPEINILLGARQVGKTTLLREIEKHAIQKKLKTIFFDLEQPETLAKFNQSDSEIIDRLKTAGQVIFIDEFQFLPNASKILKAIYGLKSGIKFYCSGSSSLEIHKHLKESLAGRRFLFRIYPLQYAELKASVNNFSFEAYLRYGGMPALAQTDSEERKQLILSELLSAYILKDIKSLVKEENIRAFNHLIYLLAQNQGSVISVHSLANEVKVNFATLNRYLDILEQTFVNFRVPSFSSNLGNELKKSCKTYFYDLGVRNALLRDFSSLADRSDRGILFESFVFLSLQYRLKPNMEIKFWRTKEGHEVDFILLKDRRPIPIEVKARLPSLQIPKGLERFLARYTECSEAYVISETQTGDILHGKCRIEFLTFEMIDQIFENP